MLIDSNILIYCFNASSPKQRQAREFVQNQNQRVFAQQNIFETLRILTHTKFSTPLNIKVALKAMKNITDNSVVIYPTSDTMAIAMALIEKYQISGSEIFDAYLVATMLSNDIPSIATDNIKHLKKYQEITVVNPFSSQAVV